MNDKTDEVIEELFDSLNPNKARLFEGSFSWGEGGQFEPPPPSYFNKNLSSINITLCNC